MIEEKYIQAARKLIVILSQKAEDDTEKQAMVLAEALRIIGELYIR